MKKTLPFLPILLLLYLQSFVGISLAALAPNDSLQPGMGEKNRGTINHIVVFISFSGDTTFEKTHEQFQTMLNDTTGSLLNPSVQEYIDRYSYHQLSYISHLFPAPSGSTVISYHDDYSIGYYQPYHTTSNPIGYRDSTQMFAREQALLANALRSIEPQIPSGLNIDQDNDGLVDHVTFILRRSTSVANSYTLNSHFAVLDQEQLFIHGKKVWSYQVMMEHSAVVDYLQPILLSMGAFKLHSDYSSVSVRRACIMSEYMRVVPPCAYTRHRCNWMDSIPTIHEPGTYLLNELSDSNHNNCYRINSSHPDQYFLLEYRNDSRYFSFLNYNSLLLYRVDTRFEGVEDYNMETSYAGVSLFARGCHYLYGGSLVASIYDSLNSNTNPYPFLTEGIYDHLSLRNIHITENGQLSFTLDPPPATHTISVTSHYGGQIVPGSDTIVNRGDSITLHFVADPDFRLYQVVFDDIVISDPDTFLTIPQVFADHRVVAYFAYTGEPEILTSTDTLYFQSTVMQTSLPQAVQFANHSPSFSAMTITVPPPFEVSGNGSTWGNQVSYMSNVQTGTFYVRYSPTALVNYQEVLTLRNYDNFSKPMILIGTTGDSLLTLTATAGANGTITPLGTSQTGWGSSFTYQIIPDTFYTVSQLFIDDEEVNPATSYTFRDITRTHTIHAEFEYVPHPWLSIDTGTLYFNTSLNATPITQTLHVYARDLWVDHSEIWVRVTEPFQVATANQWSTIGAISSSGGILSIRFNPTEVGSVTGCLDVYLNDLLHSSVRLQGTCREGDFTIAAYNSAGGAISPYGAITVRAGESITFTISPDEGNTLQYLLIDEEIRVVQPEYTFTQIHKNHTIYAFFDIGAGIGEETEKPFRIYPNPATDRLFIDYQNRNSPDADLYFEILDSKGKLTLTSTGNSVDISHLSSGIYFIRLRNSEENTVLKFVKR